MMKDRPIKTEKSLNRMDNDVPNLKESNSTLANIIGEGNNYLEKIKVLS